MSAEEADAEEPEADRIDAPDYSTASETVGRAENRGKLTRILIWLTANLHVVVAVAIVLLTVLFFALDVELSRSQTVLLLTFGVAAVLFGYPTGAKAAQLLGGPQLVWIVDVDLLDRDGAGIYSCPSPRWSEEWTVVKDELWWATPNLAFGQNVDLETRTVEGTWPGSLPEPVLMRALYYVRYNRQQLQAKARRGEHIELNAFAIIRSASISVVRKVVRTFERGTLPDDNKAFHNEVDEVLDDFGLDEELIEPEDPPGDDSVNLPPDAAAEDVEVSFNFDQPTAAATDGGENNG